MKLSAPPSVPATRTRANSSLSRVLHGCAAAVLIALHGWLAVSVSPRVGLTFDEPAHLAAGRAYWATNEFVLQPENGVLPQRLIGAPATLRGAPLPPTAADQRARVWEIARDYLFTDLAALPQRLAEARAMTAGWAMALAGLIYAWARSLFGRRGGLVALVAAAWCPHLLAHGGLATSDLPAAAGFTAATLAWWRLLHAVTWRRMLLAGAAIGTLALAKFSAVLFAPIAAMLLLLRLVRRTPLRVGAKLRRGVGRTAPLLAATGGALAITWLLIWTAYGWRYAATHDGTDRFQLPWATVLMEETPVSATHHPGIVQAFVRGARAVHLLPEAYLYGLSYTDYFSRARAAYFAGDYRLTGWRWFFPAAFALKTSLPALGLLALAAVAILRQPRTRIRFAYRLAPLGVLVAIYGTFAIASHLNLGHRHLLPIYPALYILVGAVALPALTARVLWRALVLALLGWQVLESWQIRPHYLTYFNALAGGPTEAHRYFVDSSLDWGQALPDLAMWVKANAKEERVYLAYFGTDEPRRFGLEVTRIGEEALQHGREPSGPATWEPGVYCLSATMFRRVYTDVSGPWTLEREISYRTLRARQPLQDPAAQRAWAQLRFGRLCHFLETRRPDAIVANSMFIFRLDAAELAEALGAAPPFR